MIVKAEDFNFQKGEIILIDKPISWTSFDLVKKIRYATRQKKVGHAGTLDPLANGLLLIAIGPSTKQLAHLQLLSKSYSGIIEIGKTTPSYDLETDYDSESPYDHIQASDLENAAEKLRGFIDQVPPIFSAVKHEGKRAYTKARRGEDIKLEPRRIEIKQFDLPQINLPDVHFEVTCSKGTYIRSLAFDFGNILGTGAHLKKLTRTAIGDYKLDNAWQLDDFVNLFKKE